MSIKFAYEATYIEDLFLLGMPLGYFRKQADKYTYFHVYNSTGWLEDKQ